MHIISMFLLFLSHSSCDTTRLGGSFQGPSQACSIFACRKKSFAAFFPLSLSTSRLPPSLLPPPPPPAPRGGRNLRPRLWGYEALFASDSGARAGAIVGRGGGGGEEKAEMV